MTLFVVLVINLIVVEKGHHKMMLLDHGRVVSIHGQPNGLSEIRKKYLARDRTLGCIAVTDAEIEEIWRLVPNGTPIEINP